MTPVTAAFSRRFLPQNNNNHPKHITMKTILLLALATASLISTAPSAKAGHCGYDYCQPVFLGTRVLCRHCECRIGYDHCGRAYRYDVTVVTYADLYSDGSRNTYTRTYRA